MYACATSPDKATPRRRKLRSSLTMSGFKFGPGSKWEYREDSPGAAAEPQSADSAITSSHKISHDPRCPLEVGPGEFGHAFFRRVAFRSLARVPLVRFLSKIWHILVVSLMTLSTNFENDSTATADFPSARILPNRLPNGLYLYLWSLLFRFPDAV